MFDPTHAQHPSYQRPAHPSRIFQQNAADGKAKKLASGLCSANNNSSAGVRALNLP